MTNECGPLTFNTNDTRYNSLYRLFSRRIHFNNDPTKALASIRIALVSHGESQFAPPSTLAIIAQDQCERFMVAVNSSP